jgi:hypothetical protein
MAGAAEGGGEAASWAIRGEAAGKRKAARAKARARVREAAGAPALKARLAGPGKGVKGAEARKRLISPPVRGSEKPERQGGYIMNRAGAGAAGNKGAVTAG